METTFTQATSVAKKLITTKNKFVMRSLILTMAIILGIGNVWAGGGSSDKSFMAIVSGDTGRGLVYMKVKQNSAPTSDPSLSEYVTRSPEGSGYTGVGSGTSAIKTTYFWAKPARGFKFQNYSGYQTKPASSTFGSGTVNAASVQATWDGVRDLIETTNGGGDNTNVLITASFETATSYNITYAIPVGGSYNISYKYCIINSSTQLEEKTDNYSMTPSTSEAKVEKSYGDDVVTLTTSGANFAGWYEGTTQKSTAKTYTYPITTTATVTALFRTMSLGAAEGDLSPAVDVLGTMTPGPSITVPVTAHGNWSASDFTVTFTENGSRGDVTKGTVTYSQNSGNVLSSEGTLTIPFTYNPATWGNTEVAVTVSPKDGATYGNTINFIIKASATQVMDYEACILLDGETEPQSGNTGTLAEMVALANSMDTKFTLQLAKDVTINSPLSLQKSMTFDLNDKTITSNAASAFSIDAANIDVQIVDEGFGGLGEIATSASGSNVNVVTFTQKAKLTMQGGTLSATNTGTGSAYGINITQGSTFYMTNGQLTVTGVSEARGVNVATTSDYATLNGGTITVTSPTNVYGLWSAGQSNVTDVNFTVSTSTGANAYGVYVNSGDATLTTTTITATAETTNAYGAYVNAGRLNFNGGSLTATGATTGVCGVHVASGATAMLQMNAVVTAEAIGASGTNVMGINNLGTAILKNIAVTATSPTTAATAVNTATSAVSTTIEDGTYTANTETGSAYGLHHQYGSLNVDGGTFKGFVNTSGASAYGARAAVDATIANATLHGETKESANTAYGFVGGVANKTITLNNCTIIGKSITKKAYAIYSRTNVTATGCELEAKALGTEEAYGLYAEAGTNALTNCNATVEANSIKAYGANHLAGSLTIQGGEYNVTANQATTSTAENTSLYGVYNAASLTTTINDATFTVTASNNACSQQVYGVCAKGILNSANSTYTVTGRQQVWGIYGESTLNLSGNAISASATGASSNGIKSYGVHAKKAFTFTNNAVRATASTTNVYALYFDATNSVGTIADGQYYAMGDGTTDFAPLNASATVGKVNIQGGVYSTITNIDKYLVSGYNIFNLDNADPAFATGHRFIVATENPSPYVCYIKGGNKYETLEAAMQYAKDHSGNYTIIMTQDYTLPAGEYELPSNATLLIPRNADQTTIAGGTPIRRITKSIIVENIRLTLATGAHINVNGTIEVGGEMYCAQSGQISYIHSEYARIHLEEGSLIQLNSGAYLYAWGYITGQGEIKAKNNSEVHEMFQIGDMKTMSNIGSYYHGNSEKFFLINQYYIQNIEVPTTYYFNSRLISAMASYYGGNYMGDDNIKLVGTEGALFLVTTNDESSWVRKTYDAEHDWQVWDVNSQAQLGSITIEFKEGVPVIGSATFNSSGYYLPITNNMKIHVLDGDFAITQTSELLPGASVEINKTASLTINSGKSVFVFDNDQWPYTNTPVAYSPSWENGTRPTRTNVDAALNVHGKVVVNGKLYTSNTMAGATNTTNGANIYSNNDDAGTITYTANAGTGTTKVKLIQSVSGSWPSASATSKEVTMELAKLKNGDNSYVETTGTQSGEAWIYLDDQWQKTYTNGCFEVIGSTVYAKPSEYVALQKSQTVGGKLTGVEETNHTYLTAAGKILILMDECQWWEVEATDDPAVFECKKEGYEGFYRYNTTNNKWELIVVTVTFYKNETGNTVLKNITTNWKGIPDQSVIATNPSKATTDEYTYDFYGWKSSVTGATFQWTATLEEAEADMSYRPVFTEKKRNYSITLIDANNGNVVVETPYGEKPVYTPKKDATAQYTYTFKEWSPALANVTGTATYTAIWTSTVNSYNITWKNGENVLEVDENQDYGTATAYNGTLPTKEADNNYAYTFSGWRSSITGQTYANGSTPTVAGETTYEAQYTTTPRYKVTFNNYNAELTSAYYTQGETPAYDGVPARQRDDYGYYKFIGWKNSNGDDYAANVTLPAVSKKETYTAQYEYVTDLFTITLKNIDGNDGVWSGKFGEGSTPFYNPNDDDVPVTPTKAGNTQYEYVFDGWALTKDGAKLNPVPAVTDDATYWARFNQTARTYNITYNLNGGSNTYGGYSPITSYTYGVGATLPATANMRRDGYSFGGWFANSGLTGSAVTVVSTSETGNKTFWAKWTENLQTVNVAYKCGEAVIKEGTSVANVGVATTKNVTAPAIAGYTFQNWTLPTGVTTSSALTSSTITIQATAADKTITANYKLIDYTITHGAATHGNYTIKVGSASPVNGEAKANVNQIITLATMHIDEGYRLGEWNVTAGGNPVEVTNNQFTMPAANVTISPTFVVNTSTLTIGVNNAEYGSVSPAIVENVPFESMVTVNNNTFTVNGTIVTATPTAATAQYTYAFSSWTNVPNMVTADVSNIQAVFTRTTRKYDIVWKSEDGTSTLETDANQSYGATTAFNGTTPSKAETAQYTYTFDGWATEANGAKVYDNGSTPTVGGAATYYAHFNPITRQYTITWKDADGSALEPSTTEVQYDVSPTHSAPSKDDCTFTGWKAASDGTIYSGTLPTVGTNEVYAETYIAQYACTQSTIVVEPNENKPITSNTTTTTTTVHVRGTLDVKPGVTLNTDDLILEGSADGSWNMSSGEILGEGTVNAGNAYYDMSPNGGYKARIWYAVAVPWAVSVPKNAIGDVYDADGHQLRLNQDFDLMYYNGETRANGGKSNWNSVAKDAESEWVMKPGTAYMIYLANPTAKLRFKKSSGNIQTTSVNVTAHAETTNNGGKDANWNGIANPALYHAYLNAGTGESNWGQVFVPGSAPRDGGSYMTIQMNENSLVVGQPIFVQPIFEQAQMTKTIMAYASSNEAYASHAPRRVQAEADASNASYAVEIAANGVRGDRIFVATSADKEDAYTIGQDVCKLGMSTTKPQMWINRYDSKLCVNTMELSAKKADYPLGISVPADGDYEIYVATEAQDGQNLYVTYNGRVIWNLTYGSYTVTLSAGTHTEYGLKLVQLPTATTDIETVNGEELKSSEVRKVLIDDHIYIIREGVVYTINGQQVK